MAAENQGEGRAALPPITVAKMEDASRLIERLATENVSHFGDSISQHRAARRASSERPLTAAEAGQVAASALPLFDDEDREHRFSEEPGAVLTEIQQSGLRAVDEVPANEVLLAAGIATAPQLIEGIQRVVALIEMPNEEHRAARESGKLDEAIEKMVKARQYDQLGDARERAIAALRHFEASAGVTSGEAWSLIVGSIGQALTQAIAGANIDSTVASLIGSLTPTDGVEE